MPYYIGDLKRDPVSQNYPSSNPFRPRLKSPSEGDPRQEKDGILKMSPGAPRPFESRSLQDFIGDSAEIRGRGLGDYGVKSRISGSRVEALNLQLSPTARRS